MSNVLLTLRRVLPAHRPVADVLADWNAAGITALGIRRIGATVVIAAFDATADKSPEAAVRRISADFERAFPGPHPIVVGAEPGRDTP